MFVLSLDEGGRGWPLSTIPLPKPAALSSGILLLGRAGAASTNILQQKRKRGFSRSLKASLSCCDPRMDHLNLTGAGWMGLPSAMMELACSIPHSWVGVSLV